MTSITLKTTEFGLKEIRVNGRRVAIHSNFDSVEKQGSYTWVGKAAGHDFCIFGGTMAGGSSRDWWVQGCDRRAADQHSAAECALDHERVRRSNGDVNAVGWEAKIAYHRAKIEKIERVRGVRSSSISADTGHHYG